MITPYAKGNAITGMSLSIAEANKFLTNKATLLKFLPPNENAFMLQLRSALNATIIDKAAHVTKPK